MTRRRKTLLVILAAVLLAAGGFAWYWQATAVDQAVDRQVNALLAEVREPGREPDHAEPVAVSVLAETAKALSVETSGLGVVVLTVTQDGQAEAGGDSLGDDYILKAAWDQGRRVAAYPFRTSYGKFRLEVADLAGDGVPELVLVYGTGRGTSVRSETLQVLAMEEGEMRRIAAAPYSGFFGSGARWWYEHRYFDSDGDGRLEVHLDLRHTPLGEGGAEDPESIPKQETVILDPL